MHDQNVHPLAPPLLLNSTGLLNDMFLPSHINKNTYLTTQAYDPIQVKSRGVSCRQSLVNITSVGFSGCGMEIQLEAQESTPIQSWSQTDNDKTRSTVL